MSENSSNKKGGRAKTILLVVAFFAAILVVIAICSPSAVSAVGNNISKIAGQHNQSSTSATKSPTGSPTPFSLASLESKDKKAADKAAKEATEKNFTITIVSTATKPSKDKYIQFEIGLSVDKNGKTEETAGHDYLSIPITASTPQAALKQLQQRIWIDPVLGVTWAHFLAHETVDGVKLVDHNTWLAPYNVDASQIKSQVIGFVPLWNKAVYDKATPEQKSSALKQNLAYQDLAAYITTLLGHFDPSGFAAKTSLVNYHAYNAVVDIPDVSINPTADTQKALILSYTEKTSTACAPKETDIGANVLDMRPEDFGTPAVGTGCVQAPKPSTPATPSHSTPSTPTHSTPSTPSTPTTPSHPSTPSSTCKAGTSYYPGQGCLAGKSHNPADYTYPSGKPTVAPVTTPASPPKPVNTTPSSPAPAKSSAPTPAPSVTAVPVAPTDPPAATCVPTPIKQCP